MAETTIARFHGNTRLWLVPVGASVLVVIIWMIIEAIRSDEGGVVFLMIFLGLVWVSLGDLYRAGQDRIEITSHRLVGRTGHGLFSGAPTLNFSLPFSEIDDFSESLLKMKISVKGRKQPVEFIHPVNTVELRGFLHELLAIRRMGNKFPEDDVELDATFQKEPQLGRALIDLGLRAHGKRAPDVPDDQRLSVEPMSAVIEGAGGGGGAFKGVAAVLAAIAIIVILGTGSGVAVALSDVQSRLGGSSACVTLARLHRDQSDEAVQILIERVDRDPARSVGRFMVAQFVGSAISEAFSDDAFAENTGILCSLNIAVDYYGGDVVATGIADQLEAELKELIG